MPARSRSSTAAQAYLGEGGHWEVPAKPEAQYRRSSGAIEGAHLPAKPFTGLDTNVLGLCVLLDPKRLCLC